VSAAGTPPGTWMAHVVVDASVVINWQVPEIHSDAALQLLRDDGPGLHVPDLVFAEVGNILWKKVRRGELTADQAREICGLVAAAPLVVYPARPLVQAALEIAVASGRTCYDSLYVALAVHMNCQFVTADEKLYNALQGGPLGSRILWVENDFGTSATEDIEDVVFDVAGLASPHTADEIELLYSSVTGDRLTDTELTNLTGLRADLRSLYLRNRGVTDAGLPYLKDLAELRTLYLGGTSVTDGGLDHIANLHSLRTLNLAGTAISDAGLSHLSALTGLESLVLWGTRVTDAGLIHLHGLRGLRKVDLELTRVSPTGLEELRRALPQAEILA
jgi:predicted nucleic acid-binding protein